MKIGGRWIAVCVFKRNNVGVKAKVIVNDRSGEIIGYEELER